MDKRINISKTSPKDFTNMLLPIINHQEYYKLKLSKKIAEHLGQKGVTINIPKSILSIFIKNIIN